MRVVIDASIDPRLIEAFAQHHAQTLFDLGWQDVKDHMLVKRLACDVFVTADRGFEHEHNLKSLSFGIIILHVARNINRFLSATLPANASGGGDHQARRGGSSLRLFCNTRRGLAFGELSIEEGDGLRV